MRTVIATLTLFFGVFIFSHAELTTPSEQAVESGLIRSGVSDASKRFKADAVPGDEKLTKDSKFWIRYGFPPTKNYTFAFAIIGSSPPRFAVPRMLAAEKDSELYKRVELPSGRTLHHFCVDAGSSGTHFVTVIVDNNTHEEACFFFSQTPTHAEAPPEPQPFDPYSTGLVFALQMESSVFNDK